MRDMQYQSYKWPLWTAIGSSDHDLKYKVQPVTKQPARELLKALTNNHFVQKQNLTQLYATTVLKMLNGRIWEEEKKIAAWNVLRWQSLNVLPLVND